MTVLNWAGKTHCMAILGNEGTPIPSPKHPLILNPALLSPEHTNTIITISAGGSKADHNQEDDAFAKTPKPG